MGERLAVVVTPKADRNAVMGWREGVNGARELAVRVTAAPEKGKATKAVCKLVAKSIGVPGSAVRCVRGETSHHKQLEVDCERSVLDGWLERFG
jgi:uncharacterized protein (TIGR00251 family)